MTGDTGGATNSTNLSTKRQWIAELAKREPGAAIYSSRHLIDMEWMQAAYRLTRKDGVPGIDGLRATDYQANLEANLRDLLERIQSGRYQAPSVRRAFIPSGRHAEAARHPNLRRQGGATGDRDGAGSGLRAGQDFLNCSFGFRPGR